MSIVRASTRIVMWTGGIYCALWIGVTLLWPVTRADQPIDSFRGDRSLYATPVREVVYSLPKHCNDSAKKRLIILGSSAALAYRPEILLDATDAEEVDNIATNHANITQIREVFADVKACLGARALSSTTILLITTYIIYFDDSQVWTTGYTIYELEKMRHGLYSGSPRALTPTFGPALMPWVIDILRPVYALYLARYRSSEVAQNLAEKTGDYLKGFSRSVDDVRTRYFQRLEQFRPEEATFGTRQFQELDGLVADIKSSGAGLIFVEEPVQEWLRLRSRSFRKYRIRMAAFTAKNAIPVIDLSASANDPEFRDALHATDGNMALWTRRLAERLREMPPSALGGLSPIPKRSG